MPGELIENSGYARRLNNLSSSKNPELYGRLHADWINSDEMVIIGVCLNNKLTRAREAF